jgi:hypothetical protein
VARHEAVIAGIRAYPGKARGATAEKIAAGIAYVESQVYGPELEEYQALAATAHAEAIDTLRDMHAAAVKAEQDAADREAQRIENARVAAELAAEAAAVKALALDLQSLAEGRRARIAAMLPPLAAQAVPADAAQVAMPEPVETQPAPRLFIDLDDIEAMLGFTMYPAFITDTLGIKPTATDDGAPLFNPCQWGDICDALLAHITDLKEIQCQ